MSSYPSLWMIVLFAAKFGKTWHTCSKGFHMENISKYLTAGKPVDSWSHNAVLRNKATGGGRRWNEMVGLGNVLVIKPDDMCSFDAWYSHVGEDKQSLHMYTQTLKHTHPHPHSKCNKNVTNKVTGVWRNPESSFCRHGGCHLSGDRDQKTNRFLAKQGAELVYLSKIGNKSKKRN